MKQHEQALLLLNKALEDIALLSEVLSSEKVSDGIVGFHSQQAVEKLLKALLSDSNVSFPRSHNLRLLMDLLADAGCPIPSSLAELDVLTSYGTLFRYEDLPSEVGLNRQVIFEMIIVLREFVEHKLGIR
jgi:HEPN domain-containing protein